MGMQPEDTYIGRRQAKVAHWVALLPLLELCVQKNSYEGVGRNNQPWWRQGRILEDIRNTLEEASQEGQQRHWYWGSAVEGQQ